VTTTVLVIGGGDQLGAPVVRRLLEDGLVPNPNRRGRT
jgi:hypothetical protein